jgi:hypothetical protein
VKPGLGYRGCQHEWSSVTKWPALTLILSTLCSDALETMARQLYKSVGSHGCLQGCAQPSCRSLVQQSPVSTPTGYRRIVSPTSGRVMEHLYQLCRGDPDTLYYLTVTVYGGALLSNVQRLREPNSNRLRPIRLTTISRGITLLLRTKASDV